MRALCIIATAISAGVLAGCNVSQSALHPQGTHADLVATLGWTMFVGAAAIFALVLALIAIAIFAPPARRRWITRSGFIVALGVVFPALTVSSLLAFGFVTLRNVDGREPPDLRIEVVGEMWWWRVNYLDANGETVLATANEIRIPTQMQIEFVLKSADVIHSFWAPALGGKLDMIPGRTNAYRLSASRAGSYRGQCAEFCGAQHAAMAFHIIAMDKDAFEDWFATQSRPARAPIAGQIARGRKLFFANGCDACHQIRGAGAQGAIGPDLTHVGSRTHLAAGLLRNNIGTLAAWISSARHLKPENKMPSFSNLTGEELRALAGYMESLK